MRQRERHAHLLGDLVAGADVVDRRVVSIITWCTCRSAGRVWRSASVCWRALQWLNRAPRRPGTMI